MFLFLIFIIFLVAVVSGLFSENFLGGPNVGKHATGPFYASRIRYSKNYYKNTPEHKLLTENFSFYNGLTEEGKRKFLYRTIKFRAFKVFRFFFEPAEGNLIPEILISAAAVQLTFGLSDYLLPKYVYIHVHEKSFLMRGGKAEAYGAVGIKSTLAISWEPFKRGYADPHDSWNLGIHEWSHALEIALQRQENYDKHFGDYYLVWKVEARNVLNRIRKENSGFRYFPVESEAEFFPVCMERFFEDPVSFKEEFPVLFEHTRILMNLDPINAKSYDYNYAKMLAAQKGLKSSDPGRVFNLKPDFRSRSFLHWTLYFTITTFLVLLFTLFGVFPETYVTSSYVLIGTFAFIGVGLLAFYYLLRIRDRFELWRYLLFVFMAFYPFCMSSGLLLNYFLASHSFVHEYDISSSDDFNKHMPHPSWHRNYTILACYRRVTPENFPHGFIKGANHYNFINYRGETFCEVDTYDVEDGRLGKGTGSPDVLEVKYLRGGLGMPVYQGYIYWDY